MSFLLDESLLIGIHIFPWVLDRVVHTCFAVVLYCVNFGIARNEWKKYASKNIGRHVFQIDLGIALLNHGIGLGWRQKT